MPRPKGGRFNLAALSNALSEIDNEKNTVDKIDNEKKLVNTTDVVLKCKFGCIQPFSSNQYLHQHYKFKVFEYISFRNFPKIESKLFSISHASIAMKFLTNQTTWMIITKWSITPLRSH